MGLRSVVAATAPPDDLPDDLVWHYTTGSGLISILSSHTLWATSAQFLNDAGEVELAVRLLEEELRERAAQGSAFFRDLTERLDERGVDHGISPSQFFVLSAAGGWDLLAMWRNYGGQGESYAIGLDPGSPLAVLSASASAAAGGLPVRRRPWTPVRYSAGEQDALVDAVFDDLPEELERAMGLAQSGATRDEVLDDVAGLLDDMEQALLLIKHEGFTDERETRHCTVLYRGPEDGPLPPGLVRYRSTPYGVAPYLSLTGGDGSAPVRADAARLPIRAVAMSPSANGQAAIGSLHDLLAEHGYGSVPVVRSRIPFRG